ncbi:MAG TPA: hypothetical protein VF598_07820, partial [Hymenobacter sp.]
TPFRQLRLQVLDLGLSLGWYYYLLAASEYNPPRPKNAELVTRSTHLWVSASSRTRNLKQARKIADKFHAWFTFALAGKQLFDAHQPSIEAVALRGQFPFVTSADRPNTCNPTSNERYLG